MPHTDPRIDAYIEQAAPFARPILAHLRHLVHRACPDVQEGMKWRFPHFDYKGMLCHMAAFKAHATFGFWKASLLERADLANADKTAMGQFGRIRSLDDLPDDRTLTRLVKAAARLNDVGVKVPRPARTKKPPVRVPPALTRALAVVPAAREAFAAFSPSHKREYVEWITEAKTDATRDRRIAAAVAMIAEGKSRNWKYDRQ